MLCPNEIRRLALIRLWKCGFLLLGAAVVKDANMLPDPLPWAGGEYLSAFFSLSARQNSPWILDRTLKRLLIAPVYLSSLPSQGQTAPTNQARRTNGSSLVWTADTITSGAPRQRDACDAFLPPGVLGEREQQSDWKLNQAVICSRKRSCQSGFSLERLPNGGGGGMCSCNG